MTPYTHIKTNFFFSFTIKPYPHQKLINLFWIFFLSRIFHLTGLGLSVQHLICNMEMHLTKNRHGISQLNTWGILIASKCIFKWEYDECIYTHWKYKYNVILIIKAKMFYFFSMVFSLVFYKIQHLISIRNVCHNLRIYCQNNVYKNYIYGDKKTRSYWVMVF